MMGAQSVLLLLDTVRYKKRIPNTKRVRQQQGGVIVVISIAVILLMQPTLVFAAARAAYVPSTTI